MMAAVCFGSTFNDNDRGLFLNYNVSNVYDGRRKLQLVGGGQTTYTHGHARAMPS